MVIWDNLPFVGGKGEREAERAGHDAAEGGHSYPAGAHRFEDVEQQMDRDFLVGKALPGAHAQVGDEHQTEPGETEEQQAGEKPSQPQEWRWRGQY